MTAAVCQQQQACVSLATAISGDNQRALDCEILASVAAAALHTKGFHGIDPMGIRR
jgi:hypothetical protein